MNRFFIGVLGAVGLVFLESSCGRSPTEPTNYLLPTPVATDHVMALTHDIPAVVYEGDEVTFSVTGVGVPDLGTWDLGRIDAGVPGIFDFHNGQLVSVDGTFAPVPPQAESGAADIIIMKRPFRAGEGIGFTVSLNVFGNACLHSPSRCPALFRVDILADVETGASQKRQFVPAYLTLLAGPRPGTAGAHQPSPR